MTATPKGAAGTTSTPRKAVDWEAVERDYRAGLMTDRALGERYGVSHTAIQKRAKARGWAKDLAAKIRQSAAEKVAKSEVAKEVAKAELATERQIVEANAEIQAAVLRGHRRQIGRAQEIAEKLLGELLLHTDDPELLIRIAEMSIDPDAEDANKRRADATHAIRKAMGLPGRSAILKTLSEAMKNLITLERQAFRVDETPDEDPAEAVRSQVTASVDEAMAIVRAKIDAARVAAE